jgi:hypothetical protein
VDDHDAVEVDSQYAEVWLLEEVAPSVWRPMVIEAPRDAAEPWRYAHNAIVLAASFDNYHQAARVARRLSRKG